VDGYEFFAPTAPTAPIAPAAPIAPVPPALSVGPVASAVGPVSVSSARRAELKTPRWVWAIVLLLVAAVLGGGYAVWPHSSGPGRPDPGTARIFGQQTRVELPAPVTADECEQAVLAFHAIAADRRARAAFIAGCSQG
jgi:hypothetical protein